MILFEFIKKRRGLKRLKKDLTKNTVLTLNQLPMKNELFTRLANESPSFFKKIQAIGLTLGAIGGAILAVPASVVVLPATVITIGGYFVAVGVVAAAVAKTTVADSSVLQDKK